MKLHPKIEWRIFHILTREDIDDFTDIKFNLSLKLYLNSLVYDENIFGNLRKFSENVRKRPSGLRNSPGRSSESGRKSSENRQKRRRQYIIRELKKTTSNGNGNVVKQKV